GRPRRSRPPWGVAGPGFLRYPWEGADDGRPGPVSNPPVRVRQL
ncbi:MAG: hypothetical protein AVDCRST_MAG59-3926, partial [uncultured Thermomicrobiales bacterium]